MDKVTVRHKDVWTFQYRDITVEISRFRLDGLEGDRWTYYLWLSLDKIPTKDQKGLWPRYKKTGSHGARTFNVNNTWLADLTWHHGMTWYSKHLSSYAKGSGKMIQVGCDYSHLWDEEHTYRRELLRDDAIKTVDSLYERINYNMPESEESND